MDTSRLPDILLVGLICFTNLAVCLSVLPNPKKKKTYKTLDNQLTGTHKTNQDTEKIVRKQKQFPITRIPKDANET